MENNAVLTLFCPDHKGIVYAVTKFLYRHGANIIHAEQHKDSKQNLFFMRVEWSLDDFDLNEKDFERDFALIAQKHHMKWNFNEMKTKLNTAIFVSSQDHCLSDLMYRYSKKELNINIKLIVSNHSLNRKYAEISNIQYLDVSTQNENRIPYDKTILRQLERHHIEFIILARYMRILSTDFVTKYPNKIINIHHSFLPAFVGDHPYHKAYDRGVKIIGATSHYVIAQLDEGPIIEQDTIRVSHRDNVPDLINKGKDLERIVLYRAVKWHSENKILVYGNKTVVFS